MIETLKPFYVRLLTPFANLMRTLNVHPNAVTASGVVVSAFAAWFIARGSWLLAAMSIGVCGCTDGLDGLLANITGKKTRFGAVFDSSSDRITEILWFMGLVLFYTSRRSVDHWGIYLTFLAMAGSLMVSYVRARCEGVNVPCKEGLLQRPERIIILIGCLLAGSQVMKWGLAALCAAASVTVVQRLIIAYKMGEQNRDDDANVHP